jgi:hypothetical protein
MNFKIKSKTAIWLGVPISVLIVLMVLFGQVMKNTPEHYQHNMKGTSGNVVYVKSDGKGLREVVFDKNGNVVESDENMGSYNYYDQRVHPYLHFFSDRLPWIMWGNTPKDKTTMLERANAFFKDLGIGISNTF